MIHRVRCWVLVALLSTAGASSLAFDPAELDDESNGTNWPAYGRTYSEQRYSPLDEINAGNIERLRLAWSLDLPDARHLVSTTLAVDGILYVTSSFSVVHAIDARTHELLWKYDPKVPEHAGETLRTLWGTSRGVAYWNGKIYVGAGDGRLIAVDAKTGQELWSAQTTEPGSYYYITGAPRAYNGKVVIGNGGTELGPSRGYVTAYDAETGEQVWRFWLVPGNPADGFENDAMRMAAATWTGEWWKHGGGGNAWNAITYDPDFNHVYIGTGNGSPWNQKIRSPGGGDNLFLCSVVALDADTGAYKWHYQTVPGETWDFNSAMDIVSVDLEINGYPVKTVMHAPKNAFFYVINRENGSLLSARPFAKVTWASGVDEKTGRPIEVAGSRYEDGDVTIWPGPAGAHNWQPMSWNPKTRLMYFPYHDLPGTYNDTGIRHATWRAKPHELHTGVAYATEDAPADSGSSGLLAWDPVRQKVAWRHENTGIWNAGTMTTGGDLVFQGLADGRFIAYRASDGEKLWTFDAKHGIAAPPITYRLDGRQYIALPVGWGGGIAMLGGSIGAQHGWAYGMHPRRLLVFALDGDAALPATPPPAFAKLLEAPSFALDTSLAALGEDVFVRKCTMCHGPGAVAAGGAPDLRASPILLDAPALEAVVGGSRTLRGMPRVPLEEGELSAIQHYVRWRAREDLAREAAQ